MERAKARANRRCRLPGWSLSRGRCCLAVLERILGDRPILSCRITRVTRRDLRRPKRPVCRSCVRRGVRYHRCRRGDANQRQRAAACPTRRIRRTVATAVAAVASLRHHPLCFPRSNAVALAIARERCRTRACYAAARQAAAEARPHADQRRMRARNCASAGERSARRATLVECRALRARTRKATSGPARVRHTVSGASVRGAAMRSRVATPSTPPLPARTTRTRGSSRSRACSSHRSARTRSRACAGTSPRRARGRAVAHTGHWRASPHKQGAAACTSSAGARPRCSRPARMPYAPQTTWSLTARRRRSGAQAGSAKAAAGGMRKTTTRWSLRCASVRGGAAWASGERDSGRRGGRSLLYAPSPPLLASYLDRFPPLMAHNPALARRGPLSFRPASRNVMYSFPIFDGNQQYLQPTSRHLLRSHHQHNSFYWPMRLKFFIFILSC